MVTATATLTDFLLSRIAEDEDNAGRYLDLFPDGDMAPLFRRVLAECEAKRSLVILWERVMRTADDDVSTYGRTTLGALAHPYADHPDYRDEWRP